MLRALKKEHQAGWLLKAVSLIDLTTLAGDDTFCNVHRLVRNLAQVLASMSTDSITDLAAIKNMSKYKL